MAVSFPIDHTHVERHSGEPQEPSPAKPCRNPALRLSSDCAGIELVASDADHEREYAHCKQHNRSQVCGHRRVRGFPQHCSGRITPHSSLT